MRGYSSITQDPAEVRWFIPLVIHNGSSKLKVIVSEISHPLNYIHEYVNQTASSGLNGAPHVAVLRLGLVKGQTMVSVELCFDSSLGACEMQMCPSSNGGLRLLPGPILVNLLCLRATKSSQSIWSQSNCFGILWLMGIQKEKRQKAQNHCFQALAIQLEVW